MKIVVNRCYGGFGINDDACEYLGIDDEYDIERTDANLITLIENKGAEFVNGRCSDLVVVEIPDNATDWEINEYDGCEEIIAVVDGKIKHF